jgi:hypothetical protein
MVSIYILKCQKNKYYVGKTNNIERVKNHFENNGAVFTKKYKPLSIDKIIENQNDFDEDKFVKEYMSIYGIDNVRGGSYSQLNLDIFQIESLRKEINSSLNLCNNCGESGHFINECPNKKTKNRMKTWTSEEDKYIYDNFIKSECYPMYEAINKLERSRAAILIRIKNLQDPEHISYKRFHNNNLEKIYKCGCSPDIIFKSKSKYNSHLKNKSHIIFEKTEEIKELKILLTKKDNNNGILQRKNNILELDNKKYFKIIENMNDKIFLLTEELEDSKIKKISITESIITHLKSYGEDKTLLNILSIIIFIILTKNSI